jgi:hypothetical protein
MAATAVEASASAVETTAVKPASMEASKAGVPSERVGSRNTAVIESAKGPGMIAAPARVAAAKVGGMAKARPLRMKVIAIDNRPANTAFHADALFAGHLYAEYLAGLFQARDLALGLLQMARKGFLEGRVMRALRHFRYGFTAK